MAVRRGKRAGCSPIAPVFALLTIALLMVVYFMAFTVGNSSMVSRGNQKLELTAHIVRMKTERYVQCQSQVQLLRNGQTTVTQAKEVVDGTRKNLETELELLKSRNELATQEVEECKLKKKELSGKQQEGTGSTQRTPFAEEEYQRYMAAIALINGSSRVGRQSTSDLLTALTREVEKQKKLWSESVKLMSECNNAATRYSVVFDAGSTGSRVHVFRYNLTIEPQNTTPKMSLLPFLQLNDELFVQNHAPLSKFDNVHDAAASLTDLLNAAKTYVPHSMHACVPIELKATAGLRRIGRERALAVLDAVRRHFQLGPFWVQKETDSVRILEGYEEGPLAWLTVNYLRGALGGNANSTATILDLGGGSTQIVIHPDDAKVLENQKKFTHEFHVNGRSYLVYQHSYEGNGLHAAKEQLLSAVMAAHASTKEAIPNNNNDNSPNTDNVGDNAHTKTVIDAFPCFPKGYIHQETNVSNIKDGGVSPSMEACVELFRRYVVRKNETCGSDTCGFNGVFQPNVKTASTGPVYAFSYYYDRLKPYMESEVITVGGVASIATRVCGEMKSMEEIKNKTEEKKNGILKEEMECFELSYMFTLLHHGFGYPYEQELHIAKKINGFETAWALGASLVTLEGK
ncbi:nucleoside phosphatase [Trypanosoma theileri]|uniref:Nucleoside phosphatase n=1 Tax=Trypanosoma theileri TaxID=67003 RepID=A0A1X0NQR7_9TRYP|nr:nucleoside phosphatase [Trypanosoma theileri]ORC86823.1 nucleoside phosphatase [Trypanosoma theileri]